MEIRPDRFKVVAAKTLGKIYGYVKIYLGREGGSQGRGVGYNPLVLKRIKHIVQSSKRVG